MNETIAITFLAYLVVGTVPAIIAALLLRVRFLGGVWMAMLVGVVSAVIGGLIDTIFMDGMSDLLPIGGFVDVAVPLGLTLVVLTAFGFISRSNQSVR